VLAGKIVNTENHGIVWRNTGISTAHPGIPVFGIPVLEALKVSALTAYRLELFHVHGVASLPWPLVCAASIVDVNVNV